jgi:hypothetical protein
VGGIGGANPLPAVNQSVGLIKVDRLGHVGGNNGIVLPRLGYAFHLHRQQYWNVIPLQFAGEHHRRRRTPTLTKKNDAGVLLFFPGKETVVIGVQEPQNGLEGCFSAPVLKHLDVRAGYRGVLQAFGELHRPVARIVVVNKAPDEADHDGGRGGVVAV